MFLTVLQAGGVCSSPVRGIECLQSCQFRNAECQSQFGHDWQYNRRQRHAPDSVWPATDFLSVVLVVSKRLLARAGAFFDYICPAQKQFCYTNSGQARLAISHRTNSKWLSNRWMDINMGNRRHNLPKPGMPLRMLSDSEIYSDVLKALQKLALRLP